MSEFLKGSGGSEKPPIQQERLLTEVDHLLAHRVAPGVFLHTDDVHQNLETSIQEQAMPYAVTETVHVGEFDSHTDERTFRWLGKTAVQVALSGYEYHEHRIARKRVDVEVDEARHSSTMGYGKARVFISPRMTRTDSSLKEAQKEHLGDDDAIRVSWLTDDTTAADRIMQSLLVRDVPYDAWVKLLEDPNNIFGKAVKIEETGSSLDIMKVHKELEISTNKLPKGPVSILEAVVGYIEDPKIRSSVIEQIGKYHNSDQVEMACEAAAKADEWLEFEQQLAESLAIGKATYEIRRFIIGLQHHWSSDDIDIISKHAEANATYSMTRKLAAVLESAEQKLLSARAAIMADPDHVRAQLKDEKTFKILQDTEQLIQLSQVSGFNYHALHMQQMLGMASNNIRSGGGGCAGTSSTEFSGDDPMNPLQESGIQADMKDGIEANGDRSSWKWRKGQCRVEACDTRPGETQIGPCDVCMSCQIEFDKGNDPTENILETKRESIKKTWIDMVLDNRKAEDERFAKAA